jgi:hypothetical protein
MALRRMLPGRMGLGCMLICIGRMGMWGMLVIGIGRRVGLRVRGICGWSGRGLCGRCWGGEGVAFLLRGEEGGSCFARMPMSQRRDMGHPFCLNAPA